MNYFDTLFAKKLGGGGSAPVLEEVTKSYTANGDDIIEPSEGYDGISKVNVSVNVSGGGEAPENDVEFIDYDGTIVYSYTAQEFLALDAMPANPTHEGLTAQGWNWTLADAKEYVTDVGGLIVGQMYITDDGKTRIYISLSEGRTSPYLGIAPNGTAHVEWGDGTSDDVTGTSNSTTIYTQHNYASAGDYVIKITAPDSEKSLGICGNSNASFLLIKDPQTTSVYNEQAVYLSSITKIELGQNVYLATDYALGFLYGLKTITTPDYQIAYNYAKYKLYMCYSLTGYVYGPNSVFGYEDLYYNNCKRVSFPKTFKYIANQNSSVVFSGNAFPNYFTVFVLRFFNDSMKQMFFNSKAKVIRVGTDASGVLPEQFIQNATLLKKVVMSDKITRLKISNFRASHSLSEVELPSALTQIDAYCFAECPGLAKIKFKSTTPPTLGASSAFSNLPTDCVIYVPSGSLSAYTTATNYPNPSTYTYVEY